MADSETKVALKFKVEMGGHEEFVLGTLTVTEGSWQDDVPQALRSLADYLEEEGNRHGDS